MPRKRRSHSPAFKAEVVLSLLTGEKTQAELCRLHELSPTLLTSWKETFLKNAGAAFQSREETSEEAARLAELERLAGRLTLENEMLKRGQSILRQLREKGGSS